MQPHGPACRRELERVLQQVRDDAFHLGLIKRKLNYLLVGEEVKGETFFLEARRPQPANLGEACIDIRGLKPHSQLAGLENTEAEEVLDIALESLPVRMHIAKHFALTFVQAAELLALQKLHIAIQDGKWGLEIVRGRSQCIRGPQVTLAQLRILLRFRN